MNLVPEISMRHRRPIQFCTALAITVIPSVAGSAEVPAGPASAAVGDWLDKGWFGGCTGRDACTAAARGRIDVRYAPAGDLAVAFVPWRALDGSAGISMGAFREARDRWVLARNLVDTPIGTVGTVVFDGRSVVIVVCPGDATNGAKCAGGIHRNVDLGR
jgi:hypothetical protein